jgi:hypothetical protein
MQTQMLIEGVSAWIDRVRYLKRVLQNSGMNWGKQGRQGRLLTLAIFWGITEKLFVLVFACVKAPATAIFTPK